MYRLFDDVTTDDTISLKAMMNMFDEAGIDDAIFKKPMIFISDSLGINDQISTKAMYRLFENIATDDLLSAKSKMILSDEAVIDDKIVTKSYLFLSDGITIHDSIQLKGSLNIETRDNNDSLVPLVTTYRIIPDPATGTGWKDVKDGVPGDDYDGSLNGQISVFPVPLGTYRINQTMAPAGLSSILNFTYTTVHPLDINATALFRVYDPLFISPEDLNDIDSDILDIADNGFDDLLSSIQLVKG